MRNYSATGINLGISFWAQLGNLHFELLWILLCIGVLWSSIAKVSLATRAVPCHSLRAASTGMSQIFIGIGFSNTCINVAYTIITALLVLLVDLFTWYIFGCNRFASLVGWCVASLVVYMGRFA